MLKVNHPKSFCNKPKKCIKIFSACVDFNFAVESVEHDLFRDDIRMSQATVFKSEAVPKLVRIEKNVNYYKKY